MNLNFLPSKYTNNGNVVRRCADHAANKTPISYTKLNPKVFYAFPEH